MEVLLQENSYTLTANNLVIQKNDKNKSVCTKIIPSEIASLQYEITITQPLPLYFYFDAPNYMDMSIAINGQNVGKYFDFYRWDISYAGTYQPGDIVTIELILEENEVILPEGYFYYESLDTVHEASCMAKKESVNINRLSNSRFHGSFTSDDSQTLIFTIPYDSGWHLVLDQKTVKARKALDALLAIDVPAGSHTFELYYIPSGMGLGIILAASALLTAIMFRFRQKRNAKTVLCQ